MDIWPKIFRWEQFLFPGIWDRDTDLIFFNPLFYFKEKFHKFHWKILSLKSAT